MPVDIDYTTKLSEEQRKFFSISTGSLSRRRRKTSTTFDLPYLPDQLRNCLLSNERQAHTFHRMSQDSRRKVRRKKHWKRIFFHRLFPSSSSCSTGIRGMFIVTAPFFSMHAQHMIVILRRTGAPHSVTRPRGAECASDPGESKLIAKALELDIDAYGRSLLDKDAWVRVHF